MSAEPHKNDPSPHLIVITKYLFAVGAPRTWMLLPRILSKRVKHNRNVEVGAVMELALLLGMCSKHVNHNRNDECGRSHRIGFVARHPLKACKTQ